MCIRDSYRIASEYSPVVAVRLGQPVSGQSRVVIDLTKVVPFHTQTDASGVTISFAAPAAEAVSTVLRPVSKPAHAKLMPVHAPDMPLPSSLTGKNLGLASPPDGPVAPKPISQDTSMAPQVAAAASMEKKYTGDPISVNLKDVDLRDFFRLIHEISGLNVVLDLSLIHI